MILVLMMQVIMPAIEVVDIIVVGIVLIMEQDGILLIIHLIMVQVITHLIGQELIKLGAPLMGVLVLVITALLTLNI